MRLWYPGSGTLVAWGEEDGFVRLPYWDGSIFVGSHHGLLCVHV